MKHLRLKMMLLTLPFLLAGCSSTKDLTVKTMEPAPVSLSQHIKRIAIINTSVPEEQGAYEDRLGQILSFQEKRITREGIDAALAGLRQALEADGRFTEVSFIKEVPASLRGLGGLPDNASWDAITKLCKEHRVDAIFSLAYYDTDTRVSMKKATIDDLDLLRVKNEVRGHEITLETLIENGWLIYNPMSREVVDEFVYTEHVVSKARGITPVRALEAIGDRETDVVEQSKQQGSTYGQRLKPYQKEVPRAYFTQGSENFTQARIHVEKEEWEQAKVLWEHEVTNPKPKIKARACYNLAVMHEIQGDLDQAFVWANRAKDAHPEPLILDYLEQLKDLQARQALAQAQLIELSYRNLP